MKKFITIVSLLSIISTFAKAAPLPAASAQSAPGQQYTSQLPSSALPGFVAATKVTAATTIVDLGLIMAKLDYLLKAGVPEAEINAWLWQAIKTVSIVRKINLVSLAYMVGDLIGTEIYVNLSEEHQDAIGEIVSIMIENSKAKLQAVSSVLGNAADQPAIVP